FTEIGRSSENRRVVLFSGCGCAMVGLQCFGPLALILAHIAGFCWIFWGFRIAASLLASASRNTF
ncbi:MAG: hypothetical protein ACXVJ0_16565, partial [Candidatus Angelobacter sp.]